MVQPVSQAHAASPSSQASTVTTSPQEAPPLTTGVNLAQVQGTAHMVKSTASPPVMAQVPGAFYMQSVQLPVSDVVCVFGAVGFGGIPFWLMLRAPISNEP